MDTKKSSLTPEYLAASHRKQVLLQIWLPIGIAILLALLVGLMAIIGTINNNSEVSRWADLSAILLIIPHLITSLVTMAIVFALVYGVAYIYPRIPGWMHSALAFLELVRTHTRTVTDKTVQPIVSINGVGAGMNAARKKFTRKKQTRSS